MTLAQGFSKHAENHSFIGNYLHGIHGRYAIFRVSRTLPSLFHKAIVNGRPPALLIQYTDCQFADDLDPSVKSDGENELGCKFSFHYLMFLRILP
jgi:hypothetical protein